MTRKTHMTEKMHKKMPIRHTRKQRGSGGGFLDWMMGTRRQPQLPVYGPQPQSFNPQQQSFNPQQQSFNPQQQSFNPQQQSFNPQQQSRNWYGNPMQTMRQGFNQAGSTMYNMPSQTYGALSNVGSTMYNMPSQAYGSLSNVGSTMYNMPSQTYGALSNVGSTMYNQMQPFNPIRYASNVYRNYQSNPALTFQGGKIKRRIMKGGYQDNISVTGLASTASPFSGPTAQPHQMVGGKTRKGGKKCGKTHRNKK
jgi:hypothetical protein